ncbi:sugar transferase [Arthrobacter sp. CAU 1506]|nr:sugar transferase [Arthrobacter sp. CAU 1506]
MTVVSRMPLGYAGKGRFRGSSEPHSFPRVSRSTQRGWRRFLPIGLLVSDTVVIVGSVVFAQSLWAGRSLERLQMTGSSWLLAGTLCAVWLAAMSVGQSRAIPILGSGTDEYRRVINATFAAFGLFAICAMLLKIDVARGLLVTALPTGVAALLLTRHCWRRWLANKRAAGALCERALLVGPAADVEFVGRRMLKTPGCGYRIVGAAVGETSPADDEPGSVLTIPVVATPDDVHEAVRRLEIDAVVIAGSELDRTELRELGWALGETGTVLVVASSVGDISGPRINWRPVEGLPLMRIELPHFDGAKYVLKRAFDVVAAGAGLMLALPLLLVVAAAVRLDSPGPVLFVQERIGLGGKAFRILKFRSMTVDAEQQLLKVLGGGMRAFYKTKRDPRVTRVGAFIRKYSIDELPQLINVLRGDMSLVGPRPQVAEEVELYDAAMRRRLLVKPGITGLWQVSGRSDLDLDESVRLDLYYAENWSLAGDVAIVLRTVRAVLRGAGAY